MKSMEKTAKIKVFRFDPSCDKEPRYETYEVPEAEWRNRKLIDTIRYIYETQAPGLAFREPCRQQVCGACAVLMNKKRVLACDTLSKQEMVIEPVPGHRVVKDLIVDLDREKGAGQPR
jgi:succinate dehydrogenase/fumarate reductase iron-sulfur protein